jgi:uncharacterized membrane protein YraQ (UPF0718 family)
MYKNIALVVITLSIGGVSAILDRKRTVKGVFGGLRMLFNLLPQFLLMVISVSVFLALVPPDDLTIFLGRQFTSIGFMAAAFLGSVALIPGPIAYPLVGMLYQNGVSVTILAVFITTLTMVGIFTLPIEREYLGTRIAVFRNILSFFGALLIGLAVGWLL